MSDTDLPGEDADSASPHAMPDAPRGAVPLVEPREIPPEGLDTLGRPKGVPPVGPKSPAVSQEIAERRVNAVFHAVVIGLQPWEIRQAVAQQQTKERRARDLARKKAIGQGMDDPEMEALEDVPMVWGDKPIPMSTFSRYLKKARDKLDARAPEFAKQRSRMLAQAQARLDMVYAKAIGDSRWYAALKAIELSAEMFGLREHAKNAAIMHDLMDKAGHGEDDETTGTRMPESPDARAQAFAALAAAAIATNPELKNQLGAILGVLDKPKTVMP